MSKMNDSICRLILAICLSLALSFFYGLNSVEAETGQLVPLHELSCYSGHRKYMDENQFQQAYAAAVPIVRPLLGLPLKEQVVGLKTALRKEAGRIRYTMSDAHYNDPYGYFVLHVSSCAGCTRATAMCLNMLGIEYEHVNSNQWKHQWCRIKIGNEYWICDAFGDYAGPEPAPYKHPVFANQDGSQGGGEKTVYIPLEVKADIGTAATVVKR